MRTRPKTALAGAWRAPDSGEANPGPRRTDPEREPHIHVLTGYAPPSGGGPAPLGFAGFLARREDRSCMERYTRRIYVRVTDADLARAKALAEGTGLSVSDLVRLLLQLPAGDASAQRAVVLDLATANRLYRELNHWGYQRNQAVHALNRIAYYLRRNDMDAADVLDALAQTKDDLDAVRRATGPLASSVRSVAESRILFL